MTPRFAPNPNKVKRTWPTTTKAIRTKCLDCSTTFKDVKYCTMDGVHSQACPLWPFRFGCSPKTVAKRFGKEFITPADMPDASISTEDLP